jgi:hypothetical protein
MWQLLLGGSASLPPLDHDTTYAGTDTKHAAALNSRTPLPVVGGFTQNEGMALGASLTAIYDSVTLKPRKVQPSEHVCIHGEFLNNGAPLLPHACCLHMLKAQCDGGSGLQNMRLNVIQHPETVFDAALSLPYGPQASHVALPIKVRVPQPAILQKAVRCNPVRMFPWVVHICPWLSDTLRFQTHIAAANTLLPMPLMMSANIAPTTAASLRHVAMSSTMLCCYATMLPSLLQSMSLHACTQAHTRRRRRRGHRLCTLGSKR